MAADVAQDATKFFAFEKPRGARWLIQAMRSQADHLKNAADGALLHEIGREHRRLVVNAFAIINHVLSPGAGRDTAGLLELLDRGERRFVGEVVLASFHHATTNRAALRRHRRGGDELHFGIGQNFIERTR
jgi:hypothetical protein